jgi:hypothetical protein
MALARLWDFLLVRSGCLPSSITLLASFIGILVGGTSGESATWSYNFWVGAALTVLTSIVAYFTVPGCSDPAIKTMRREFQLEAQNSEQHNVMDWRWNPIPLPKLSHRRSSDTLRLHMLHSRYLLLSGYNLCREIVFHMPTNSAVLPLQATDASFITKLVSLLWIFKCLPSACKPIHEAKYRS